MQSLGLEEKLRDLWACRSSGTISRLEHFRACRNLLESAARSQWEIALPNVAGVHLLALVSLVFFVCPGLETWLVQLSKFRAQKLITGRFYAFLASELILWPYAGEFGCSERLY